MRLELHNRQRKIKVSTGEWQKTFEALLAQVQDDLVKNTPQWLTAEDDIDLTRLFALGTMSCQLISDKSIAQINRQWRDKNRPTDVLSFPIQLSVPFHLKDLPLDSAIGSIDCDWQVGELFISVQKALEQSIEYGHSIEREMAFLFVHACLHVMGFDHIDADDEKEMMGRQKRILDRAGFARNC